MDLLKEFREFSWINCCSGMKFKILHMFLTKFSGRKVQFCPRIFTNIAEINRKTHGICRNKNLKKEPGTFCYGRVTLIKLTLKQTNINLIMDFLTFKRKK